MNPLLLIVLAFGAGTVALGLWALVDHVVFTVFYAKASKRAAAQTAQSWGGSPW